MLGNKSPLFPAFPPHKHFQRKPPVCSQPCARGAPSLPAPRSRGLRIASFCQFFAPYLTAEGRIKQSSQISYQVLSCTVNLTASTLCNSDAPKRALSNAYGSRSRVSIKKKKKGGGFSLQPAGVLGSPLGKVGSGETPQC